MMYGINKHSNIFSSSLSKLVNAWKVQIGNSYFIVTPAHVALYSGKDGLWRMSHFLEEYKQLNWQIPLSYVSEPLPSSDFAWAEIDDDGSYSLQLQSEAITSPTQVDVIFRQPYGYTGAWNAEESTIGMTVATLYKSPDITGEKLSFKSKALSKSVGGLLEAVDIGFRGMSGAIALHAESSKCVGLFVARGSLISFKKRTTESILQSVPLESNPPYEPINHMSAESKQIMARLDRMTTRLDGMTTYLEYLYLNGLTRDDIHELGVVVDARRGIFLPATTLAEIPNVSSVSGSELVGLKAPKMPPR